MVITNQQPFRVWDEHGKGANITLNEDDLVEISMIHTWQGKPPPPGRFQGIEDDDGQTYVVLEIADRIDNYEMRNLLRSKSVRFRIEAIDHINLLARRSSASTTLFNVIGRLLAQNTDLTATIEEAKKALNPQ